MKKLILLLAVFTLMCAGAQAQMQTGLRGIGIAGEAVVASDEVRVTITVDPSDLQLRGQQQMVITPVLAAVPDGRELRFSPCVLAGGRRLKALQREMAFGKTPFETEPQNLWRHRRSDDEEFTLAYRAPVEDWMRGADLVVMLQVSSCPGCEPFMQQILLTSIPAEPQLRITYIVPQAEPKVRTENHVCRINYVVDRYELLVNYKNNARVLAGVDRVVSDIMSNPYLKVTACEVDGYASPEGYVKSNQTLSENRARAFLQYMSNRYGWDSDKVASKGHGEDWQGLRDTVASMESYPYRGEVLDIIDNTPDYDMRKRRLEALENGKVYKELLATVYPPLRRNEFRISYEIQPFTVEEAIRIFEESPALLSLNEMFFVAQSYPVGSEEFKKIFDTAVRIYPQSGIANVNAAAMEIEYGAVSSAIDRLSGVDLPEAWNNLGVAYALEGDYALAAEYLEKALAAGAADAEYNLKQLKALATTER